MTLPSRATNAETAPSSGDGGIRPTLLIADDDAVVRTALRFQLGSGFEVIGLAENATDAINLAERHRPDAALIDVEMPGGGAAQAIPRIASCSPQTCMVVLSGAESRQCVLDLLKAGAVAYIRKGVTGADLSTILTQALTAYGAGRRG
jgi:two-component system nitrate/nitrite response regulator NarL